MDRRGEGIPVQSLLTSSLTNMIKKQYTLLTEILKKAGIPSSYLVRMINELRISPSWGDIPLPQGS